MQLTPDNVRNIFLASLPATEAESTEDRFKLVEGIALTAKLDATKHQVEIEQMLSQLPIEFRKDGGGGW